MMTLNICKRGMIYKRKTNLLQLLILSLLITNQSFLRIIHKNRKINFYRWILHMGPNENINQVINFLAFV